MQMRVSSSMSTSVGLLGHWQLLEEPRLEACFGSILHAGGRPESRSRCFVVMSYSAWQSRYGGDSSILGKQIRLNRQPYMVLGVAPAGFHGTENFYWA